MGQGDAGSVTVVIRTATTTGIYYVIAKADAGDGVAEFLENNNTLVKSISMPAGQ